MSLTSSSLMHGLKNPDNHDAWLRLCRVYQPLFHYWMTGLQVQKADQEDLMQNILLIVCQKFPDFQHNGRPGAFRTWLRTITALQIREYLRKQNRGIGL